MVEWVFAGGKASDFDLTIARIEGAELSRITRNVMGAIHQHLR